jgi:hypothetical protein
MNQQMHNSLTNYYTAPTCFDIIVSDSGSSKLVPAKLHKYVKLDLVINT